MDEVLYDLFVIGGGVNGCGIARDAVGRGFSVYLAERDDLASGTSSAATKLVHGGLRYLEHYEFRLVRESLMEREVLWAMAPHIIWPMRFVLPHHAGLRPAPVLRAGLFLYDHIGGRKRLPPTRRLDLGEDVAGKPLKPEYALGFEYSDCWVDDARLVVLNARDAADRGAMIATRSPVLSARHEDGHWRVEIGGASPRRVRAKMLVNAAGPWVDAVLGLVDGPHRRHNVRLVQGSHIVVNRLFEHDRSYIFQNADGRVLFAIPYEQDFTLIGTTDRDYEGDPADAKITAEETAYMIASASDYFAKPLSASEIVWSYSGVRPLYDDGASKAQEATRDYVLKLERPADAPALLNVFGGKLTTYRRLAEAAMEHVEAVLGRRQSAWTASSTLPGGGFAIDGFDRELDALAADHPGFAKRHLRRLLRQYGTRARALIGDATGTEGLGPRFGADLSAREVDFLKQEEWAVTPEDVLWRRTKLGLRFTPAQVEALARYMRN